MILPGQTKPLEQLLREEIAQGRQFGQMRFELDQGLVVLTVRSIIPTMGAGGRLVFRVEGDKLTPIPQAKPGA